VFDVIIDVVIDVVMVGLLSLSRVLYFAMSILGEYVFVV
jgi:hypothetical protein